MTLRDYQEAAVGAAEECWATGAKSVLWSLPTGTGKTVAFSESIRRELARDPNARVLVLAHRKELLSQARDKFLKVAPEHKWSIGMVQGEKNDGWQERVVIASVPSLQNVRLDRYQPGHFALVVTDEAHHATADTYRRIIEQLKPRKHLLVTATPFRGDKVGLRNVCDVIAYNYALRDAITDGWLVDLKQYGVETDVWLDQVKKHHGDLSEKALARAVNTNARNVLIAEAWKQYCQDRQTVVFCVDVAHAQAVAATFQDAGVDARTVWGAMGDDLRKDTLAAYSRGEFPVLTNCAVLTEGWDEPMVRCVIMGRPTTSTGLYTQMIGRGTRLDPNIERMDWSKVEEYRELGYKTDLMVLDIEDNASKHKLVTLATLWGLDATSLGGRSIRVVEEEEVEKRKLARQKALEKQRLQEEAEEVEEKSLEGQVRLFFKTSFKVRLKAIDPFDGSSAVNLLGYKPESKWQHTPATDKQLNVLRKRGMSEEVCSGLTKGQAAHLIGQTFALEDSEPPTPNQKRCLTSEGIPKEIGHALNKRDAGRWIGALKGQTKTASELVAEYRAAMAKKAGEK